MNLKLAKIDLNDKPRTITIEEIEKQVKEKGNAAFYFDKDNSLKDLEKMCAHFAKSAKSTHFHELRFGLDKDCILYELHIIDY
ncbi:MAG: hypothetical protein IKC84_03035 [Helicobacteraceae bacterium]|nr:hypothetical protein [Helicobacteraceae bacterium]